MLAYSYTRISTSIQVKGHGLKRQKGYVEKYCKNKGLTLAPDRMQDIGSGYHGKNLTNGALGLFLEKLEAGDIPTPCALVIEALDRLIRILSFAPSTPAANCNFRSARLGFASCRQSRQAPTIG